MARWERQMIGSVPAEVLDAESRERVSDLLRTARDRRPQRLDAGLVVEFLHAGQLSCGYLRFTPLDHRALLIIDRDSQERRLRGDKILHYGSEHVAVTPPDRGVEQLHLIDKRRQLLAAKIDLGTLRELAIDAARPNDGWGINELCTIHDSTERPTSTQRAAMLRALFGSEEFRRVGDLWIARTDVSLQDVRRQRRRREHSRQIHHDHGEWLRRLACGEDVTSPPDAGRVLDGLAAYVLSESDDMPRESIALVQAANLHGRAAVFDLLVRAGYWQPDENLEMHRQQIPLKFSSEAEQQASDVAKAKPLWHGWPCWGQTIVGLSDPHDSDVCLRAWSVHRRRRGWRLRYHSALPALMMPEGGVLKEEIYDRGVSIRLPDRFVPLIPRSLLAACSFRLSETRPGVTIIIDLDETGQLQSARLRRSRLRLQLALAPDSMQELPATAKQLGQLLRRRREASGAWEHVGGERLVRADGSGVVCGRQNTDTPRAIDREFHFLGEQALAVLCQRAQLPAIYRTRSSSTTPQDDWPSMPAAGATLFRRWQMEGHCPAETLQISGEAHVGLGTAPRAIGLSPEATVADLLMQRQLLHLAGVGPAIGAAELEDWLIRQRGSEQAAEAAKGAGRRHWCLRWLADHPSHRPVAWVAARRGAGYLVLFDRLPMTGWVAAHNGLSAQVGDRLSVAIQRVSIRDNEILLTDPRREPEPER